MRVLLLIFLFISIALFSDENQKFGDETPSSEQPDRSTTATQDSAFKKAMQENVPNIQRIKEALRLLEIRTYINRTTRNNPWAAAKRNLSEIPDEYYQPSGNEIIRYNESIYESQYIPTFNNWPQRMGGFTMPLSTIGAFLGLTEDRSPTINFDLEYYNEVEVVVYSIQATVIATVFKGKLTAGSYSRTWNGRDDYGKKMPKGDYIIEVRIGDSKYVRKWVKIN